MIREICLILIANLLPVPGITTATVIRMGYIYGYLSFPYIFTASLLGSSTAFMIGRHITVPPRWKTFSYCVENSYYMLILLRLSPTPSSMLSYTLGSLDHIQFQKFLFASAIGLQKLWIDLMIGHNMNEITGVVYGQNDKYIQTSLSLVGLVASCMIVRQIQKNVRDAIKQE